jgi:uncharacterized membrane protein YdjX (TVP38/TMEM64 family)
MKAQLRGALLLAVVLALAVWIVGARESVVLPAWLDAVLVKARLVYAAHPALTVLAFCAAHFVSSFFSIPGSCTLLNVSSGAVFGFWAGCAIVYPITLLSACAGYFAASHLRGFSFMARYETLLESLRAKVAKGGFLFLVTLRLSPIFPYGTLNPLLGLLRVPFGTFIASTFVGIFLDVFLLNSIGATLAAAGSSSGVSDGKKLLLVFCGLLASMFVMQYLSNRPKVGELE